MRRGVIAVGAVALVVLLGLAVRRSRASLPPPGPASIVGNLLARPSSTRPPAQPQLERTGRGQLTGRVRRMNGEPAAGVAVEVIHRRRPALPCQGLFEGCGCGEELEDTLAVLDLAFQPLGRAITAPTGGFTIGDLPSGELEVRAYDEAAFATRKVQLEDRPREVELTLGSSRSPPVMVTGDEGPVSGVGLMAIEGQPAACAAHSSSGAVGSGRGIPG